VSAAATIPTSEKPRPAKPYEFTNLPIEMKSLRQFVMWRYKWKNGRWTKVPHQVNGEYASATNPETWTGFPEALTAQETGHFDGIGFVFAESDPLVFIDFDHVIKDGKVAPHVVRWLKKLNSYTELSPSGEGLHVYGLGVLPGGAGRKKGEVEIYDRKRFATLTGWCVIDPEGAL
jgi:putative DNA primase/helicase